MILVSRMMKEIERLHKLVSKLGGNGDSSNYNQDFHENDMKYNMSPNSSMHFGGEDPYMKKSEKDTGGKKPLSRSSSKNSNYKSKRVVNYDPKLENPYKINYWTKVDKIEDDGKDQSEVTNMLRRKVADLRSQLSKLTVAYNDLKSQSSKELSRLKSIVELEKNRRLTV